MQKTIRLLALLVSLLSLFACSVSRAANIAFVSDNPNTNGSGAVPIWSAPIAGTADDTFITLLQGAGHNVVRFTSNDTNTVLLVQADIDALNTNDLIILGRSLGSGAFQTPQGNQWNTNITKPLICQSSFLIRASRLGWMTNESSFNGVPMPLARTIPVNSTNAYLFGGTVLNGNVMTGNYDLAMEQNTSQSVDFPIAGGRVLATGLGSNIVIADFQAGTAVKFGTNILAGYRMYFASGNREASAIATAGSNNLTSAGQSVFLRAVTLALNNGVPPNLGVAPSITLQPTNQAVCVGLSVSLVSAADGENPLSYQWYFDDTVNGNNPLPFGTNATLTLTFQNTNAGNYTLVVTNAVGSITSAVAVLSISGTGTIASAIANQTNCLGSSATFTTTATGSGTLTYTWRKGASVLQGPDGNNSYNIPSLVAGDAGQYSVTVVGDCNTVSNSFIFVVAPAPIITAQPQNQITPMGNGATFSVTALTTNAGAAPLSYQWMTNGVDVTGATGSSFSISNLPIALNGLQVSVAVTNCAGGLVSSTAILTVTPISGLSFDFNTPGQFTNAPYYLTWNNWINNGFVQPPIPLFESGLGGVGAFPGSGSLDMIPANATENTSILLAGNYDFSLPGNVINAATMVKIKNPTANQRMTQFGFVSATNLGVNDQTPQSFATVILQSTAQPAPTFELRHQRRTSGGGLQESTLTGTASLTVSNWYKLGITYTNTRTAGNSNYAVAAYLQDMGPLGTTPGAIVLSFVSTTNNSDIVNFRNVYLALRGFENGGAENRDNTYVWTAPGNIFFVQQPQNLTLLQGRRDTFKALVDGEGPYTYQWQKSTNAGATFDNIPGAGDWKYIVPSALTSDNASQYRVVVTGPANSLTSDPATLTVTSQTLGLVSVGSVDGTTVGVQFNQPVDPVTAANPANYTINGVNPVAARVYRTSLSAMGPEGIYVILTPASVLGGSFTVVGSGINDLSGGVLGGANSAIGSVAGLIGYDVNPLGTGPLGENYSFAPGQFIVTGGGVDIFSGFDGFRFVYAPRTGDFDLKWRLPYMDSVRFTAKAGVDARSSLAPDSPGVLAAFDPGPIAEGSGTLRQFTEGTAKTFWGAAGTSWGNATRLFHPDVWMRFRRVGNSFLRYSSTNGVNWLLDGQFNSSTLLPFPDTMYVGLAVCSARNLQAETAQFENFGDFGGYPGAVIVINSSPTNITVAAGGAATIGGLVATVTGGGIPAQGELAVQWQRTNSAAGGWTNMPTTAGATNQLLSVGTVWTSDSGARYRAILQAPGALSVTSVVATLTVTDTGLPTISSVNPNVLPAYPVQEVVVSFSELMGDSATNGANYVVTNANGVVLSVLSAEFLHGDRRAVLLKVGTAIGVGNAGVTVSGVRDLNNNLLATATRTFRSFFAATAPVVTEVYQDIGAGTTIPDLTGNAIFTAGAPTYIVYSNLFGYNVVSGFGSIQDNYGTRSYTYFVPPTNGQYKFWVRNDDYLALFINSAGTNPAGKILIASNAAANGNYSVGTLAGLATNHTLVAGQPVYLEVLHKEGTGGDGWSVMWTDSTVNTAPAVGAFIPTANLAYPDAVAPATPVVMELYTGYLFTGFNTNGAAIANGNIETLVMATNFPNNNYQDNTVNYKYIAGLPDGIAHQKYMGVQPGSLGNTRFDNYLGRALTFFVAPTNGNYKFYLRADDSARVFMNTNAADSTNPVGKKLLGGLNAFTSAHTLIASNVTLVGGQSYYLETLWREGGGGDGFALAVRSQNDPTVPAITGTAESIPSSMLRYPDGYGRGGAVAFDSITATSLTVPDGQSITLAAAGIRGAPPYGGFIWYKNGQQVGINIFTNVTPPLTFADNGSVYTLVVTNAFSRAERSVTVNVTADGTAPTLVRTVGSRYNDGFSLQFSEPMDAASATFLGNYQISGGLGLLSASLDVSRTRVSFLTTAQPLGTNFTVTINGVRDASSSANLIAANTMGTFSSWGVGGTNALYVEVWTNIQGGAVADLANVPKYQANLADYTYYTNVFAVGRFAADSGLNNYGARISGIFTPTNTGLYRFYCRSDDASQLWMNINNTDSRNPAGRTLLVHVPGANQNINNPNAISAPVALIQGQGYYMEALLKEGTGGDYFQMTFRACDANGTSLTGSPVDNTVNENISGAFFGVVPGNPDVNQFLNAVGPPAELTVNELDPVNLTLTTTVVPASLAPFVAYQWQRSNVVDMTFTNIPGKTTPVLSFYAPLDSDGATFRLIASLPGTTLQFETLLHVNVLTDPQQILSVSSLDGYTIGVRFKSPVDHGTGETTSNYEINGGAINVLSAVVRENVDPRTVLLTLQFPVSGDFDVTGLFIGDQSVSFNGADTYNVPGTVQGFTGLDVGAPLQVGSSFTSTNGEISVVAGGADIWGTADQGHLTVGQRSGDFDIWTRVDSLIPRSASPDIAKAGLVVRDGTNADAKTLTVLMNPPASIGGRDLVEAGARTNWLPGVVAGLTGVWPSSTNVTPAGIPNAWVRIKREGFIFRAFWSSNGVDWIGFATNFMDMPRTVTLGLGTTAHNNLTAPTVAEYKNMHIPNPPGITTQPSPGSQSVAFHGSTSYTVVANNPANSGSLVYTWRRNGVVVGTGATLSIPDARGVDAGSYQVEVGNDGGSVLSDVVSLSVNNGLPTIGSDSLNATQNTAQVVSAASLIGNDSDPEGSNLVFSTVSGTLPVTVGTNFSEGNLIGATLYPATPTNAVVGTNGYLRLHSSMPSLYGTMILDELTPGKRVGGFTARFKLRLSEGTLEPADGFSFNFAPDLTNSPPYAGYEDGATSTGFSFCVDNYRFAPFPVGGTANTSGMKLRFGGVNLAAVQMPTWNRPDFVPVTITVLNGTATVTVDGTNVFGTVILPSVTSTGRFGFYARNGGQLESAMLDDLSITVYTATTTNGGTVGYSGGNVTYSNAACSGSDTFYYIVGDGEVGGDVIAPVAVNLYEGVTQAPLIVTCATNRSYTLYTNSQIALPNLTGELVVTDNCGTPVVTQSPLAGTLLSEGPNVVTFTATDAGGSNSTCQITITVVVVRPQIIGGSISFGGGTFSGSFQTANGVNYNVEYKNDLNAVSWTLLTTIVGDGTIKPFTDPGPLPPMRYYRITPQP